MPTKTKPHKKSKPKPKEGTSGGNKGYAGYEYQVQVSVWVALVLLVAKSASESISIETKSDEDIEAAINNPDRASLSVSDAELGLYIQVKSRSSAPWTAAGFAAVLTGEASSNDDPRSRKRPLELLKARADSRYLLITNESLNAGLRSFQVDSLIELPQQGTLPAAACAGLTESEQTDLSQRIAIIPGINEELLDSKTRRLLGTYCHVPASQQDSCIRDLSDVVRSHMTGKRDGAFTKQQLLDVCARYGGSLLPTRAMDHYIKPQNFEMILRTLDERNVVIIAGPSGNGKSLTADVVEHQFRTSEPPYSIHYAELGPSSIRSELLRKDSVLFHLRDPWGSNRISPQAESWSSELPKLLTQANAGHKFLITSRSDVMSSAMRDATKKLAAYTIPIELEDYGNKRLEMIYDGISSDLPDYSRALARQYRKAALANLLRPYEIDRFLVTLSQQDPSQPRDVEDLLTESQIDAISSVVCQQVSNLGQDSLTAATILWAVLKAREAVTRDELVKLARGVRNAAPHLRSDMDGLIEFLVAGRNLRSERNTISFYHPRVEDGLRLAVYRKPLDAEEVLSHAVDSLLAQDSLSNDWGAETALGILRATCGGSELSLAPSENARLGLDTYLTGSFFKAKKNQDSARTLKELATFGSTKHAFTELARTLTETNTSTSAEMFGSSWKPAPLSEETVASLRNNSQTQAFLARFIIDVLPFSRIHYGKPLSSFLRDLSEDLSQPYRSAIEIIASPGGPNENMDAIIEGACTEREPDFDWIIDQFVKADGEATAWFEKFKSDYHRAEEHEVDAAYADRIFDEPGEQFYNSQTGLKKLVFIRSRVQGVEWLESHKHRELLIESLGQVLQEREMPLSLSDLQRALGIAGHPGVLSVWKGIEAHWDESFRRALLETIASEEIESEDLRKLLLSMLFEKSESPIDSLKSLLPAMSQSRRFELLVDIMTTALSDESRGSDRQSLRAARALEVVAGFSQSEIGVAKALVTALAGSTLQDSVRSLSQSDKVFLKRLLGAAPVSVTQYLSGLAVAAGIEASAAIQKLLANGDSDLGENAVLALGLRATELHFDELYGALKHPRYAVRREAMKRLLPQIADKDRPTVLFLGNDKSADVRLSWAEIMSELRWTEAIPSLVYLLKDDRNFNSDPGFTNGSSWARYSVARAAAHALESYDSLPLETIDALVKAVETETSDPFVTCAAIGALANKEDDRIGSILAEKLEALGFEDSPNHRPVAQAAAWAIFDRAVARQTIHYDASVESVVLAQSPVIVGPVLMALAFCSHKDIGSIEKTLKAKKLIYRVELLSVAHAIFHGEAPRDSAFPIPELARLVSGISLSNEIAQKLQAWSLSLQPKQDVQPFTAWLVKTGCKLPTNESFGDPREYDLPERIGFMSMRSLTPFREINDREVDKGL